MKTRVFWAIAVLLLTPAAAAGQQGPISVGGAVGSNLNGGGNGQSLSIGFAAGKRIDFVVSAERNHLPTAVTRFERGSSATRGGTTTFVSGEVQFLPLTFSRISPYALAGVGRGISRPNVNEFFPTRVENDATLFFAGGGVRVPITDHLSAFADIRFVLQSEIGELGAFQPVRGGVTWRF